MNYFRTFAYNFSTKHMSFFWKSTNKNSEEGVQQQMEADNTSDINQEVVEGADTANDVQAEAQDVKSSNFQQIVRAEAKKMRLSEQLLTPPHLARIEDALRLNETKMENIEENIVRTRKYQERVRRYQELQIELHDQKDHLYEINKQLASSINDREELDRFEEFENIQGQFQRLSILESIRHEQKQHLTELTRMQDINARDLENETKLLQQKKDELRETIRKTISGLDAVTEAQHIEGRTDYIITNERKISERLNTAISQQTILEKEMNEHRQSMEKLHVAMEALRTRRQSLAPHHRMAKHGDLILERLLNLSAQDDELQKVEQQLKESTRKQTEENDMLSRIYVEFQQIEQDIEAAVDELSVHRENNHGLEGYRLQERAMRLKLRREMLISGQSLWHRIANGYSMIEEVTQRINTLRLKEDTLKTDIQNLSKELSVLRRTCHEKEYTFTLSKSQNVIQLRSDLREGLSCTVCGATHHPYHSDTMLEQNKLIGDLKMEFESLATELRAKEERLHSMEMEVSAITATKEEAENTLITLRSLQNGFISDWEIYSNLDTTFQQCDSTVNAEARTAMLRQLIENIGTEVDLAQKELDTFNFHQNRINELSEAIGKMEQKRNELITRLNEVNTGCQVMASLLDRVQTQKQSLRDNYSRMSEVVDGMITIPDWKNIWNRSHEALIMRIKDINKEWDDITEKLNDMEYNRKLKERELNHLQQVHQSLISQITMLEDDRRDCRESLEVDKKTHEKLIGKRSCKQILKELINTYTESRRALDNQREVKNKFELTKREILGKQTECIDFSNKTDERASTERQGVDVWMRKYNANHPPVQYTELEKMFVIDRNWNDIRAHLRSLQLDALLTQARVDKLGSQIISLQAEGSISDMDTDVIQNQLSSQIETFETRRKETMMQIALLTQQLNAHKKAENAIKEEQMRE